MTAAEGIVEELFAIIDERRWDHLADVFEADCVYERPGYGAIRGVDELRRYYQSIRVIENGEHHIDKITCSDNWVVCFGSFAGVSRTGEPLRERFADAYELERGRIRFRRTYFFRPAI